MRLKEKETKKAETERDRQRQRERKIKSWTRARHGYPNWYYINVNVAKLGSKAGMFLSGKRKGRGEK